MDKCKSCGKELIHEKGKRKKQFCNNTCRSSNWTKLNKVPKVKTIPISKWNIMVEKIKLLESLNLGVIEEVKNNTEYNVGSLKSANLDELRTNHLTDKEVSEIENQIKEWQIKKCPSYIPSVQQFENMRYKAITELKEKLNQHS